jgi:hypothetical protein
LYRKIVERIVIVSKVLIYLLLPDGKRPVRAMWGWNSNEI